MHRKTQVSELEMKTREKYVIEATRENCEKIAQIDDSYTVKDIAELLGRCEADLSDVTITKDKPIARQGDLILVNSTSHHFVDPEKFGLELKEIKTDTLQKSSLNGHDHRLVSVNSAYKVFESKGVNQHEAYSKMGLPVQDWMKQVSVGNMYIELGEGTFLAHQEHAQRVLNRGCYEVRRQLAVDTSGLIRRQLD